MGIREIESLQDKAREMTREYRNMINVPMSFLTLLSPYEICVYSYLLEKNGRAISIWKKEKSKEQVDVFFFEFTILELTLALRFDRHLIRRCLVTLHKFELITWFENGAKTKKKRHACCINFPMFFALLTFTKAVTKRDIENGNGEFSKATFDFFRNENLQKEIQKEVSKKALLTVSKIGENELKIWTVSPNNEENKRGKKGIYLDSQSKSWGVYLDSQSKSFGLTVQINLYERYLVISDSHEFSKTWLPVRYIYTILKEYDIEKIGALPSESPCAKNHRARKMEIDDFKYLFSPKGMEEILPKLIEQKNGEDTKMKNLLEKEKSPIENGVDEIIQFWNTLPNVRKHKISKTTATYKTLHAQLSNLLGGRPLLCGKESKPKKALLNYCTQKEIPESFLRRVWTVDEIKDVCVKYVKKQKSKFPKRQLDNFLWMNDLENPKEGYSYFMLYGAAYFLEGIRPFHKMVRQFVKAYTQEQPYVQSVILLYRFAKEKKIELEELKKLVDFAITHKDDEYVANAMNVPEFIKNYDKLRKSKIRMEKGNKKKQSGIDFYTGSVMDDLARDIEIKN